MAIQTYIGIIDSIKELSSTVRHYVLDLDVEFDYKAGQFVNLSFEVDGEKLRRPYSIASNPVNGSTKIELCIKLVENGTLTPKLWDKKQGDKVNIQGPLGLFTLRNEKEKLVFIGTGTGIAPLRSMIIDEISKQNEILESDRREGVAHSKEIILIFGVRSENEIIFREEFDHLAEKNPNFKFVPVVSRPTEKWDGRCGHVQDNFDVIDSQISEVYICGLPAMFDSAKEKLLEIGVDGNSIFHEVFR